jgi:hypothetical protein
MAVVGPMPGASANQSRLVPPADQRAESEDHDAVACRIAAGGKLTSSGRTSACKVGEPG